LTDQEKCINKHTFYAFFTDAEEQRVALASVIAREKAYCPYSHFKVGAALVCEDGSIFSGVNIENSSFGATICAERSAFAAAISSGKEIVF